MPNSEPIEILLVEDNAGDARLAEEALKENKVHNNIYHVKDGVEAMAFLRREGPTPTRPSPTSSSWTSTCRARTGGRSWRRSRTTRRCA